MAESVSVYAQSGCDYPRNWVGYGNEVPAFQWSDNVRLVINLVLNYEEGAERNILDGDAESESYLSGFPALSSLTGQRSYSSESLFSYGSRSGCWRLFRLFDEYKLPVTVFACGLALERNPELAHYLTRSEHEVAGHGYRWIDYRTIPEDQERLHIIQTLKSIKALTKKNVSGWYTGRKSKNTRQLLIESGLFYDSDDYSDDFPWWYSKGNRKILVLPYTLINNDCLYGCSPGWSTPEHFLTHLKFAFDSLYRDGEQQTQIMTIGLHSRISGHPARTEAIRIFLEYSLSFPSVSFTTRQHIAREWARQSPPGEGSFFSEH